MVLWKLQLSLFVLKEKQGVLINYPSQKVLQKIFNYYMEYKICKRCYGYIDPEITFDNNGICKHCRRYDIILDRSF